MSKDYLSIDISDLRINFVEGRQIDNEIYIKKMFYVENNNGFIQDGEIIDAEALGGTLKSAIRKNKVKTKNAIVTVSPVNVEIKEKIIDKVDESLILDIVKVELLSDGINLDEYEIQVLHDEKANEMSQLSQCVKIYLMKKIFITSLKEALKISGMTGVHLDITSNGLVKLHKHILKNNILNHEYTMSEREEATVMYLDLSNESIQVNVMKGLQQELYRSQDNHLYQFLVTGEPTVDVVIDQFVDAIEVTSRYYKSTMVGNYIDEILVYGFNDRLERIDLFTDLMMDRLITNVNPIVNVDGILTGNVDENVNISSYLNAINALIRL